MIEYKEYKLDNGLKVLLHKDIHTPMVATSLLYDVGSRDEDPKRTGFAHLFEHLMFSGSKNAPDFDEIIQKAGGENNAYTNSDYTNFYNCLPANNLDIALWLEADRMENLAVSAKKLDVQRKVVIEEFKETCLNEPYGDVGHLLGALAYKEHPYQWPVIGKTFEHIEQAKLSQVRQFYEAYYHPRNAILAIAGNIDIDYAIERVEYWFGGIHSRRRLKRNWNAEPPQQAYREKTVFGDIPVPAAFLAFHMVERNHPDYPAIDLLSDILGHGPSSRLHQRLVKDKEVATQMDCYLNGTIENGLFYVEARTTEETNINNLVNIVWDELNEIVANGVEERELQKVKNKLESNFLFSELSVINKAINLSFYANLGDLSYINKELDIYRKVNTDDVLRVAKRILRKENCATLIYKGK